ncbi:MAG: hypothetical protein JWM78_2798 [Verrucomicrobiaceae bacterium]|nr:hypothetical protein [Verrucomicrobiaceae bacterium]
MKRFILACALIGSIGLAQAQTPAHHGEPPAAERAANLQKILQLNDDQTAKVKKIFESNEQQRKALFEKYKPQFEAFRADQKKLHEQAHAQIAAVLTPKQAQALEALHEAREHGKHHWREHGPDQAHDKDGAEHGADHGPVAPK